MTGIRLSVAIPIHNEESVLPELLRRGCAVLDGLEGGPHELVFVDDGSTDQMFEILREAALQDSRILVIYLSRNFGHQSAITAALDHVTGDAAVVMDGDLQDSPEATTEMVDRFRQGYDLVHAKRVWRKEPWILRLSYFVFYRMIASPTEETTASQFGAVPFISFLPPFHKQVSIDRVRGRAQSETMDGGPKSNARVHILSNINF